jgi:hypothetical protein
MPFITPVKTQAKLALQEFYHFYDVDAKNRPVNGRACGLILKETEIGMHSTKFILQAKC